MVFFIERILSSSEWTFESRDPKLWKKICFASKAAFGVCSASLESPLGEIDQIESVQRKAISIPIGFEKL